MGGSSPSWVWLDQLIEYQTLLCTTECQPDLVTSVDRMSAFTVHNRVMGGSSPS